MVGENFERTKTVESLMLLPDNRDVRDVVVLAVTLTP